MWVLAGTRAPRVVSDQVQVGVEGFFGEDEWFASLEGYYRTFDGVITINAADDPNDDLGRPGSRRWVVLRPGPVPQAGSGDDHGMAFRLLPQDGSGPFRTPRLGLETPPGLSYPPVFDRRLDIDLVLRRTLGWWGLSAGLRANFGTGIPYTPVLGRYDVFRRRVVEGKLYIDEGSAVVLGPRNGKRFPVRHRLDVSFRKPIPKKWGQVTPYLSVINLYNRKKRSLLLLRLRVRTAHALRRVDDSLPADAGRGGVVLMAGVRFRRAMLGGTLCLAAGCALIEVTIAEPEDLIVAEVQVVLTLAPDTDELSLTAWAVVYRTHWPEDTPSLSGTVVEVSAGPGRLVRLEEQDSVGHCLAEGPSRPGFARGGALRGRGMLPCRGQPGPVRSR